MGAVPARLLNSLDRLAKATPKADGQNDVLPAD